MLFVIVVSNLISESVKAFSISIFCKLTEVLQTKGYNVVKSNGKGLVEKAISDQPDIIILNSIHSDKQEVIQTLRFEKGLESVVLLIYE